MHIYAEHLTGAAQTALEAEREHVVTVEELSQRFNVSTKTISRWRRWGLVSRRFVLDGRRRVGFLESAVERFVAQNSERVRRAAGFSHMSDEERDVIIERAKRLICSGRWPADVIRCLAESTGRSRETIRYTLKQPAQKREQGAAHSEAYEQMWREAKQSLYQQYRRGESLEALARRSGRTDANVRRAIFEIRAQRILELPLNHISNPQFAETFRSPALEKLVAGPTPRDGEAAKKTRAPSGLPPYLASLYDVPLLTRAQEVHLFRKMNYLLYKAAQLRETLDADRPKSRTLDLIEACYDEAVATKNHIIRANLRLVVAIAKRHIRPTENFFELFTDGNHSLILAVDKFEFRRGYKFSTYASWAITKNFARTIPDKRRHQSRFRTSQEERFAATEDRRTDQFERESAQVQQKALVKTILGRLDNREQQIVMRRFGLQQGQEPRTLKQVGAELGVTKERIRQIEARALRKLHMAVKEVRSELPLESISIAEPGFAATAE